MRRNRRSPHTTAPAFVPTAIVALALLVCASLPTSAFAAGPQETIRQLVVAVSAVLDDPAVQGPARKIERKNRIARIIHDAFDFENMARDSLGAQWAYLAPMQREEFARLFADVFEQSYSLLVLRFLGERTTTYAGESIDGNRAVVRTFLVSERDGRLPVEYRLASLGERWVVVDVVVDGVSLAANYRVQFSKIIRTSSYEALLRRMRKQAGTGG